MIQNIRQLGNHSGQSLGDLNLMMMMTIMMIFKKNFSNNTKSMIYGEELLGWTILALTVYFLGKILLRE